MAAVAREMNLSETSFLTARPDGGWALRWFTPAVEVDLCGHATLAAAHVLWEDGHAPADESLEFHTRSGVLRAAPDRMDDAPAIRLDFPAVPAAAVEPPAGLLEALGVGAALKVGRNRFDYLVEVATEAEVRALRPDMGALARFECRGAMVTAPAVAGSSHDFVVRWFGPQSGVPEDPVTGSAFCCLAPYWSERFGRAELMGYQASARGGFARVRLRGDRVDLIGHAVTVVRGELVGAAAPRLPAHAGLVR
jgi:PhzF family phenazine biosynthesis protein